MTAPDHMVEPLENLLRERGHPYMVLVRSTPFQTEWKKDGETHYGQTFAVNELSLLTAKSDKKERQDDASQTRSRRSR